MSETEGSSIQTQINTNQLVKKMDLPVHSSTNLPEHLSFKNLLQEFSQRSGLPLPVYGTHNEGAQHAPKFRSTVLVDGVNFTSVDTFQTRKAAEQDAAKVAFFGLSQKIKDEGCPLIREDTIFCKSILNEYAVKMSYEKPTYTTVKTEGLLPVFVSSTVLNGITYAGTTGTSKKEAEQLAARAAILSILAKSGSGSVISEVVKSKFRLYAALNKVKDLHSPQNGFTPVNVNPSPGHNLSLLGNIPTTAVSETCSGQPSNIPGQPPVHEFKKPKLEASYEPILPPIAFVPSDTQPSYVAGSTSGRKQSRKNKKAKKKQAEAKLAMVPLAQVPPCSVAQ